ncbi:MAG: RNA methyltransferase [Gemmatimonadetes bacterium]|nr:RNA methyltransferase [Gemmatimonadota bacterium]NNM03646.1 RNA methyltransferase [Gemmatimonadota bacterium]
MGTSHLQNVIVVLNEPQNLVNIAGAVRAMMNMGLRRLRLVRPAEFDAWRIGGIAHRSEEVVNRAEVFETLSEAVADATFVLGTTARARTAHRNYVRPREVAGKVLQHARDGTVALLFGREDRGLDNDALDLCHASAIIPTDPVYSSLNLAQAVLLLTYEVFLASGGEGGPLPRGKRSTRPATMEELENTYAALEEGLHRIEFYKAREPAAILRTLRTVISRAEPDLQEAGLLRAIGFEIGKYLDRADEEWRSGERGGQGWESGNQE